VKKRNRGYSEFDTVNSQRNELIPEEFPEGPYGSPNNFELGHNWQEDQHVISAFAYENRQFHEGIERQIEPRHLTHDDPREDESPL
jgi:hypothetical protein